MRCSTHVPFLECYYRRLSATVSTRLRLRSLHYSSSLVFFRSSFSSEVNTLDLKIILRSLSVQFVLGETFSARFGCLF